jgi:hypothetical protein
MAGFAIGTGVGDVQAHIRALKDNLVSGPVQCQFLLDIFGNPFESVMFDPVWLIWSDAIVPRIAQAIYDDRAFDRMPLLAEALEAAGCECVNLLDHCRQPADHVRGCWVVDLLHDEKRLDALR